MEEHKFISLAKAVAQAHSRLFPDEPSRDPETLQAIALALTELIPVYWRDPGTGLRYRLAEHELAGEVFPEAIRAALIVSRSRLDTALETLQVSALPQASLQASLRRTA